MKTINTIFPHIFLSLIVKYVIKISMLIAVKILMLFISPPLPFALPRFSSTIWKTGDKRQTVCHWPFLILRERALIYSSMNRESQFSLRLCHIFYFLIEFW